MHNGTTGKDSVTTLTRNSTDDPDANPYSYDYGDYEDDEYDEEESEDTFGNQSADANPVSAKEPASPSLSLTPSSLPPPVLSPSPSPLLDGAIVALDAQIKTTVGRGPRVTRRKGSHTVSTLPPAGVSGQGTGTQEGGMDFKESVVTSKGSQVKADASSANSSSPMSPAPVRLSSSPSHPSPSHLSPSPPPSPSSSSPLLSSSSILEDVEGKISALNVGIDDIVDNFEHEVGIKTSEIW